MRAYLVAERAGSARPSINGSELITRGARRAREAMRNAPAAFVNVLARFFDRMDENIERLRNAERNAFFSEAVDLCDLEHRIRHYERTGLTRF
jgi:hypothetical protein